MAYARVSRTAAAPFTAKAEMAAVVVNAKPAAVLRESPVPCEGARCPSHPLRLH